uniref:Uncharacterized protein n=1 Tax=Romanomermis culicivorax TaxID=13658 RepID=A0A915IBN6_ROMCU
MRTEELPYRIITDEITTSDSFVDTVLLFKRVVMVLHCLSETAQSTDWASYEHMKNGSFNSSFQGITRDSSNYRPMSSTCVMMHNVCSRTFSSEPVDLMLLIEVTGPDLGF